MTRIYKFKFHLHVIISIVGWFFPGLLNACDHFQFRIDGLRKTDEVWFRDYLELDEVSEDRESESNRIRQKIMTTDIFIDAQVQMNSPQDVNPCLGTIRVQEKWTAIPVIRGAYGGGTPLIVLGAYETNAFGRLLAVGGELRRYGNMAPGGIFYVKSPRAWRGLGLWGGEILLDRRRRDYFNDQSQVYAHADTEALIGKFQILTPYDLGLNSKIQIGLQAQLIEEKPTVFFAENVLAKSENFNAPDGLDLNPQPGPGGSIGPLVVYDGLSIEGLNLLGTKIKASSGFSKATQKKGSYAELELFSYLRFPAEFNFATHVFAASTTQNSVGSVYYLGGFDSIRGLPDGIHYGNKSVFLNFEARMIAAKFPYAHLQPVLFCDTGSVWMNHVSPYEGKETSMGAGIRIAIPQIYRFIVRMDYGVSVGHTKSRGFSVGLNQFFQPYKLTF